MSTSQQFICLLACLLHQLPQPQIWELSLIPPLPLTPISIHQPLLFKLLPKLTRFCRLACLLLQLNGSSCSHSSSQRPISWEPSVTLIETRSQPRKHWRSSECCRCTQQLLGGSAFSSGSSIPPVLSPAFLARNSHRS